jgi:hypothetical protein
MSTFEHSVSFRILLRALPEQYEQQHTNCYDAKEEELAEWLADGNE